MSDSEEDFFSLAVQQRTANIIESRSCSDAVSLFASEKLCQVCLGHPFLYKCPHCLLLSCSLACSKTHASQCLKKKEHEDNSRVGGSVGDYVPITEYGEEEMFKDVAFLQQVEYIVKSSHEKMADIRKKRR